MNKEVNFKFGNRIRVRVCGLLIYQNKILVINHSGLNKKNIFWALPGGGMNENESIEDALIREFLEETGLSIQVDSFIKLIETIKKPLHAVELFFKVSTNDISPLKKGIDPELTQKEQIIQSVKWFSEKEISKTNSDEIQLFLKKINKDIFVQEQSKQC